MCSVNQKHKSNQNKILEMNKPEKMKNEIGKFPAPNPLVIKI